jgi:hypothetical protein
MQHAILKKAALSVIVCVTFTGLVVLSFQWSDNIALTQFAIIYFTHILLFYVGLACLIVRILRGLITVKWFADFSWKFTDPVKFRYIFLGIGNAWMGMLAIVLYEMAGAEIIIVKDMLPNLMVGLILLANSFFSKSKSKVKEVLQDSSQTGM